MYEVPDSNIKSVLITEDTVNGLTSVPTYNYKRTQDCSTGDLNEYQVESLTAS